MTSRAELLAKVARGAVRSKIANDRFWQNLVMEKTRQNAELETAFQQILMLCAESGTGYLRVEEIYEKLSGVRQG